MIRLVWLTLCSLALLGCATTTTATSAALAPAVSPSDPALAEQGTRYELTKLLVSEPRCAQARAGFELCSWWLGKNNPGYASLARQVDTRGRVALVCELPIDGSWRAAGSCTVHRHLESELFNYPRYRGEHPQRDARQELTRADSAVALSRWLGTAPQACAPRDTTTRECIWLVRRSVPAYVRAVWALGKADPFHEPSPQVRFICSLPADGTPRAARSCTAELAGRAVSAF